MISTPLDLLVITVCRMNCRHVFDVFILKRQEYLVKQLQFWITVNFRDNIHEEVIITCINKLYNCDAKCRVLFVIVVRRLRRRLRSSTGARPRARPSAVRRGPRAATYVPTQPAAVCV